MSKKYDQSRHYSSDICPECGKEYRKYDSKQFTCKDCRGKVVGFLLSPSVQDILKKVKRDKRSLFVREAIREKAKKDKL